MKLALLSLVILTIFKVGDSVSPQACSLDQVSLCLDTLPVLGIGIIPQIPNGDLNQMCSTWVTRQGCLNQLNETCGQNITLLAEHTTTVRASTARSANTEPSTAKSATTTSAPATTTAATTTTPATTTPAAATTTTTTTTTAAAATTTTTAAATTTESVSDGNDTVAPPGGDSNDDNSTTMEIAKDGNVTSATVAVTFDRRDVDDVTTHPDDQHASDQADQQNELEIQVKTTQQGIQEMKGGYEYLCDEDKKQTYEDDVRLCASEKHAELSESAAKCQEAYRIDTWWLNKELNENVYKFCTAALNYLGCLKSGASEVCGDDVGNWVWSYHLSLWQPHLDDIDCNAGGGMDAGALALITICATAAGLTVIFVAISFAVKQPQEEEDDTDLTRQESKAFDPNHVFRRTSIFQTPDIQLPIPNHHGILKHRRRHNSSFKHYDTTTKL